MGSEGIGQIMDYTLETALQHSGMKNIKQDGYSCYFEYKDNKIELLRNNTPLTDTYSLWINGKHIATRCNYRTAMRKIKLSVKEGK